MPSRNEYDKMSSATPNPDSGLRQAIIALLDEYQSALHSNTGFQADKIMQLIAARDRRLLERIRKWIEYNKHDMGELGEFIRTQYVYNELDNELAALGSTERREADNG